MIGTKCVDELPVIKGFDDCAPNFRFGEIHEIIISHVYLEDPETPGEGLDVYPDDISSAASWTPLLEVGSGGEGDEQIAYRIPCRAVLSEPDQTEVDASKGRTAYPPAEWEIEARVDDLHEDVYEGLRGMRNKGVRFWFLADKYIYGGPQGIVATSNSFPVIEEGKDSLHNFHTKLKWNSGIVPASADAPTEWVGEEPAGDPPADV